MVTYFGTTTLNLYIYIYIYIYVDMLITKNYTF